MSLPVNIHEFDACQKCSLCESFCPVMQVEPSFLGPKMAGPNNARLVNLKEEGVIETETLDLCTDCRTCNLICPNGIKPATLIMKQRWHYKHYKLIRDSILSRPDKIGNLVSIRPSLANWTLKRKVMRKIAEKLIGIAEARNLPTYAPVTFYRWHTGIHKKQVATYKQVVYFYGCYTNFYNPELGKHLVQLLENNGIEVVLPEQHCCGLPLSLNGNIEAARTLARDNLDHLLPYIEKGAVIIFTCPSCASMFKSYYVDIFGLSGATKVAKNCFDACEFMLNYIPGIVNRNTFSPVAMKITYHAPCHLRIQGIGTPALDLLSLIPSIELHVLDSNCCGMAGTYGYKVEKYELSMKIGASLFQNIKDCTPDKVVTECGTCALQIREGTGFPVIHPVDLLYQAYTAGQKG